MTAEEAGKDGARATPAVPAYAVVHFALAAVALTWLPKGRERLQTGVAIAWAAAIVAVFAVASAGWVWLATAPGTTECGAGRSVGPA